MSTLTADPVVTLNEDPTLAVAVQADSGCATVIDTYRPVTTSGLKVGDCVTLDETKLACSKPHLGEVSLVTSYPAGPGAAWPGNDGMSAFADQTCSDALGTYLGVSIDQSQYIDGWFSPNPGDDWNGGDREIVCTIESADGKSPITGSVKGSAA